MGADSESTKLLDYPMTKAEEGREPQENKQLPQSPFFRLLLLRRRDFALLSMSLVLLRVKFFNLYLIGN